MPSYRYTAKSFKGEVKSGVLEAKDEHELARILRQSGFILTSANIKEKKRRQINLNSFNFLGGVSLTERMMFTRNLRVMISAGISLPRALTILSSQSKSQRLRSALNDITDRVTKGQNFSEALTGHPTVFPELFVSMIKVGEESGTLEATLKTLTLQLEREYELRSKIKGAMMYPAVVIAAMIGIGILMLATVVPQLAATFKELGVELPLTTRIVIALGNFVSKRWYTLPFILLILLFLFRFLLRMEAGKKAKDSLLLQTPIIAPIVKNADSAHITRTLGSLISAGVPIVQALEIVARSIGNTYYRNALYQSAEKTKKGGKLSEALSHYSNLFPLVVIQMVQVGEETGQTADILQKLAEFYEEEVTNATKNLSSVIEPVLMLIVGAVVGFFAVSMIQPMYSMLGAL